MDLQNPVDLEDRLLLDLLVSLGSLEHQLVPLDLLGQPVQLIQKIPEFQALQRVPEVQVTLMGRSGRESRTLLEVLDCRQDRKIPSLPEVLELQLFPVFQEFPHYPDLQQVLEIPTALEVLAYRAPRDYQRILAHLAGLELLEHQKFQESQLIPEFLPVLELRCSRPDLQAHSHPATQADQALPQIPSRLVVLNSRGTRSVRQVLCHPGVLEVQNFLVYQIDQLVQRVQQILDFQVDQELQLFRGFQLFQTDPWNP